MVVATAGNIGTAAGRAGNVVETTIDDEGDILLGIFGAGEDGTAFLDARRNDVAVSVGLNFGDKHGHVDHGGGLSFQVHWKNVLAGAVAIVEGNGNILCRFCWIPQTKHGVVSVGNAPVVGELALTAAHPLSPDFENVRSTLVHAARGKD